MRLHHHPLSPYSRKAVVAVEHRAAAIAEGQPIELVVVDVFQGGLKAPAFQALSPYAKMPLLESDEGPIIESTSIIEYLEERGPRVLLPVGRERMARHFDRLGDLYLIQSAAALFWRPESDAAKATPEVARTTWAIIEKQLEGRSFVVGDAFTLGDLGPAIATDYLAHLGVAAPPPIKAWLERCFELPAMKKSRAAALPFLKQTLESRFVA